jgi:hypothetical protein
VCACSCAATLPTSYRRGLLTAYYSQLAAYLYHYY